MLRATGIVLGAVLLVAVLSTLVGSVFQFLWWALLGGALVFAGVVVWARTGGQRADGERTSSGRR